MYHHSYATKVVENRYVSNPNFRSRKSVVRLVIGSLFKNNSK